MQKSQVLAVSEQVKTVVSSSSSGIQVLDSSLLVLVSGGAPRGGWNELAVTFFADDSASVNAPRGGWAAD